MRRALTALGVAAMLMLSGCSSSSGPKHELRIDVLQLVGPSSIQPVGNFDVQYGVVVENLGAEPVTIKRVDIRQVGTGMYVLTRATDPLSFSKVIAPGTSDGVSIWMHAFATVRSGDFGSGEPVTVRAVVYFDSPAGPFQQIAHKTIGQLD